MAIRTMLVDDSAGFLKILKRILSEAGDFEVVALAENGQQALEQVESTRPDVIVLDVQMPEMNGIEMLTRLRAQNERTPVVMFSAVTKRGASATIEALMNGADDYVLKPDFSENLQQAIEYVQQTLVPKLRIVTQGSKNEASSALLSQQRAAGHLGDSPRGQETAPPAAGGAQQPTEIVCICASTGGPELLGQVLGGLSPTYPLPVVVIQQMLPEFFDSLIERMEKDSALTVSILSDGTSLEGGKVWFAPPEQHVILQRPMAGGGLKTALEDSEPVLGARPSFHVLLESTAKVCGGRATALLVSGGLEDGLAGAEALAAAGGRVLAPTREASRVWSLPMSLFDKGLCAEALSAKGIVEAFGALTPSPA